MPVGGGYDDEFGAGDVGCEGALFGGCEEAVSFDADDECARGEGGEDGWEGGVGVWCVRRGDTAGGCGGGGGWRRESPPPREVVRVHFARDVDIAVGVEPGDELGALVAEVGLC